MHIDTFFKKHGFPPYFQHGVVINNCANVNVKENDSQSVSYVEDHHELDTIKFSFTPYQHKALIALLQGSSILPAHSVNHLTTKSFSGRGIICTLPNLPKTETFILDSSDTDHIYVLPEKKIVHEEDSTNTYQITKWFFSYHFNCWHYCFKS